MEIAQLLLNLFHAWGMDPDLDPVCESKLRLLRSMVPISFGVLSNRGYMCLLLPTWQFLLDLFTLPVTQLEQRLLPEMIHQESLY